MNVFVDSRGYAHDDNGNSWYVGAQYQGDHQGHSAKYLISLAPSKIQAPSMVRNEQSYYTERLTLLALALVHRGDQRGLRFVQDLYYKRVLSGTTLSDKQTVYLGSLERKNMPFINKIPKGIPLGFSSGDLWVGKNLTSQQKDWLDKHFEYETGSRGFKPTGKAQTSRPTLQGGGNQEQESVLEDLLQADPTNNFVKSILSQVRSGRTLSEKQMSVIRRILYQKGKRNMAEIFRSAATPREDLFVLVTGKGNIVGASTDDKARHPDFYLWRRITQGSEKHWAIYRLTSVPAEVALDLLDDEFNGSWGKIKRYVTDAPAYSEALAERGDLGVQGLSRIKTYQGAGRSTRANKVLSPRIAYLYQRISQSRTAKEFSTEKALRQYLKEHPKADPKRHTVKEPEGGKRDSKVEERAPKIVSPDLQKYKPDTKVEDLKPKHRKEIEEYKIDIVGEDARQAIEIARKIKKGIERAADICKMNPSVCQGNKGLTRDKMPQIEGGKSVKEMLKSDDKEEQAKAKAMVQAGADPDSDKTILQQLLDTLGSHGIKTTETQIPVGHLKATQSEIKAGKVYSMAENHLKGKFDNIDASVVVSKDGHILDGHHRWAALLTIDPSRKMKVKVVDMNMDDLLKEAASFPGVYQADFQGNPLDESKQKAYKEKNKSRFKARDKAKTASVSTELQFHHAKVDFDGDVLLTGSDIRGIVQVYDLPVGGTVVDNAGSIIVDSVKASNADEVYGAITKVKRVTLRKGDAKVKIAGEILLESGKRVPFKGTFVPTGYLLAVLESSKLARAYMTV